MKISSISAENFRGFLNHQSISFGPHVTILVGPNGFGKSTVIDALEWLLTGQLDRYMGSEEGRREDYIRHVDARNDPLVEASFVLDGREVTMQRQRVSREKSELRVRSDADKWFTSTEADVFLQGMDPDISKESARTYVFSSDFISYHLLGQQTIRDFVQSDPRKRYEKLAPIIGVDRYVRLTEILLQTARRLGDQQLRAKEALSDQTARVASPDGPASTLFVTATPLRVIREPVLSEFWRPPGKFSFGVSSKVVEVKNLHDNPRRHRLFANLCHSALYRNEYFVFHFSPHFVYVQF